MEPLQRPGTWCLRAEPWAHLVVPFSSCCNKLWSMFPGMKENEEGHSSKKPGGCRNTRHTTGCSWIKHALPLLSMWLWMDFHKISHFTHVRKFLICLYVTAYESVNEWYGINLVKQRCETLDQITGDLEIERGLKPSFALHFVNEYGILSRFIRWQMSLFFEGTWGDLILVLGYLAYFPYLKISNFTLSLTSKSLAIIYHSSDYGI